MMRRGRPLVLPWRDDAATLYAPYRRETKPDLRSLGHTQWLVRTGTTAREAARALGVHERSVQQWIA